jgi:hypothetical protein
VTVEDVGETIQTEVRGRRQYVDASSKMKKKMQQRGREKKWGPEMDRVKTEESGKKRKGQSRQRERREEEEEEKAIDGGGQRVGQCAAADEGRGAWSDCGTGPGGGSPLAGGAVLEVEVEVDVEEVARRETWERPQRTIVAVAGDQ